VGVFFLQLGVSPHSGFSPDGFSSTFRGLCFGVSKCVEEFRSFLNPNIFSGTSSRKKMLRASSFVGVLHHLSLLSYVQKDLPAQKLEWQWKIISFFKEMIHLQVVGFPFSFSW